MKHGLHLQLSLYYSIIKLCKTFNFEKIKLSYCRHDSSMTNLVIKRVFLWLSCKIVPIFLSLDRVNTDFVSSNFIDQECLVTPRRSVVFSGNSVLIWKLLTPLGRCHCWWTCRPNGITSQVVSTSVLTWISDLSVTEESYVDETRVWCNKL